MTKKFTSLFITFFTILLPIITFNLIADQLNSNNLFPVVFSLIGISNSFAGIILLNNSKKILSFSNFLLAGFFFVSVAAKLVLYN